MWADILLIQVDENMSVPEVESPSNLTQDNLGHPGHLSVLRARLQFTGHNYSNVPLFISDCKLLITHGIYIAGVCMSNMHHFALLDIKGHAPPVRPFCEAIQGSLELFPIFRAPDWLHHFSINCKFVDNLHCIRGGTQGAVKNRQGAGTVTVELEVQEGGVGGESAEMETEAAKIQFGEVNRAKR